MDNISRGYLERSEPALSTLSYSKRQKEFPNIETIDRLIDSNRYYLLEFVLRWFKRVDTSTSIIAIYSLSVLTKRSYYISSSILVASNAFLILESYFF